MAQRCAFIAVVMSACVSGSVLMFLLVGRWCLIRREIRRHARALAEMRRGLAEK
jgi:uncharacterized membrane protein YozB (DUF420 family)